jgi:ElaB/YqjD/DUF883 family membrane-anchored ribosome-binding protein
MSKQDFDNNSVDAMANGAASAKSAADDVTKSVQSSARNFGDSIARSSSDFAEKVNGKFKDAVNEAEPLVIAARDRTNDIRTALVEEIKARPLQAVMVAGLAGLVVGVLTSR